MEKINLFDYWIILCLGLLLMGCATTESVRIQISDLQRQVDRIQEEKDSDGEELRNELTALKDSYKDELTAIEKEVLKDITAIQNEIRRSQVDLALQREKLRSEIRNLAIRVEQYRDVLNRLSKDILQRKEDITIGTKIPSKETPRLSADKPKDTGNGIKASFKSGASKGIGRDMRSEAIELVKNDPTLIDPVTGRRRSVEKRMLDAKETYYPNMTWRYNAQPIEEDRCRVEQYFDNGRGDTFTRTWRVNVTTKQVTPENEPAKRLYY